MLERGLHDVELIKLQVKGLMNREDERRGKNMGLEVRAPARAPLNWLSAEVPVWHF